MHALKLDTMTEPDGTLTVRLPRTGRFRIHVEATWEPDEADAAPSLLDLEGTGAGLWQGVDAQDFVSGLRGR